MENENRNSGTLYSGINVFNGIDDDIVSEILLTRPPEVYKEGEVIIEAGSANRFLFVIASGSVAILKESNGSPETRDVLGAGRFFGGISFLNNTPSDYTVTAKESTAVFKIAMRDLQDLPQEREILIKNVAASIIGRVNSSQEATEEAARKIKEELERSHEARKQFTYILILITLVFFFYNFLTVLIENVKSTSGFEKTSVNSVFTLFLATSLMIVSWGIIRFSKLPVREFGLTFRNSGVAIKESLIATAGVIVLITIVKVVLINSSDEFSGHRVVEWGLIDWTFFAYLFVAPVQEFIGRGVFQSSFERIITGKHSAVWALILASLVFGVTHTYYSLSLTVITVVSSLLWGWLYQRHRTIVGISISHFITGNYLILMDFWKYLS